MTASVLRLALLAFLSVALLYAGRSSLADWHFSRGDLTAAYRMAPWRRDFGFLAVVAAMKMGDCGAAIREGEKLLKLYPYYFDLKNNVAVCYAITGYPSVARRYWTGILTSWPYHEPTKENLERLK